MPRPNCLSNSNASEAQKFCKLHKKSPLAIKSNEPSQLPGQDLNLETGMFAKGLGSSGFTLNVLPLIANTSSLTCALDRKSEGLHGKICPPFAPF